MSSFPGIDAKRRLGRGLSALLGGSGPAAEAAAATDEPGELRHIAVDAIARNPFQPRKMFDAESLGELAASIREHGVLQPLLVREVDGGFQLIAGERRLQAAHRAGLMTVPCRIVDVIDKTACEYALEENLKRQDLGDLEKAQAFRDYINLFQCTVEELSRQLSMNRSTVSNILRLLDLPEPVQHALASEKITAGHARALLPLEIADQLALCGRIQAEGLSVRKTEAAARKLLGRGSKTEGASAGACDGSPEPAHLAGEDAAAGVPGTISLEAARTAHVDSLQTQLRDLLGLPVEISLTSQDSGTVRIPFSSNDEFEHLLRVLRRSAAA